MASRVYRRPSCKSVIGICILLSSVCVQVHWVSEPMGHRHIEQWCLLQDGLHASCEIFLRAPNRFKILLLTFDGLRPREHRTMRSFAIVQEKPAVLRSGSGRISLRCGVCNRYFPVLMLSLVCVAALPVPRCAFKPPAERRATGLSCQWCAAMQPGREGSGISYS